MNCRDPFFVFFLTADGIEKEVIRPGPVVPQFAEIRKRRGFKDLTMPVESITIEGPSAWFEVTTTIPFDPYIVGTLEDQAKRARCSA